MCLILFALGQHPDYPLVVAANRDEFYDRPTREAGFWPESPALLAGRDLHAGGTWLGITRQGRFAAVTNVRDGRIPHDPAHRTRGELTLEFLNGSQSPAAYLGQLEGRRQQYGGFNLLVGDGDQLWCYSNRDDRPPRRLTPGIYGLSNAALDTPWPKVQRGKAALAAALDPIDPDALETLLRDDHPAADGQLPDTHIDREWERLLSPCFIRSERYGTRACTLLLQDHKGGLRFVEQNFDGDGAGVRNGFEIAPDGTVEAIG